MNIEQVQGAVLFITSHGFRMHLICTAAVEAGTCISVEGSAGTQLEGTTLDWNPPPSPHPPDVASHVTMRAQWVQAGTPFSCLGPDPYAGSLCGHFYSRPGGNALCFS